MHIETMENAPGKPSAWIWAGAEFEPADGVPVTDRGFRYGMSVFESFPVRDGVGIFLDRHLERLRRACAITGLAGGLPPGALERCEAVLKSAGDGFARIYITAGDGLAAADCDACRVIIMVEARQPVGGGTYHRGYDLGICENGHVPLFGGAKTGNYWANLGALREGMAHHHETLLFTPGGHLISACMANVFLVKDGCVHTPALSTGARAGVVREWVMQRVEVAESLLTRAALDGADELFLTSSWLGIMPVAFLEQRPLSEGKVSRPLLADYQKEVESK